MKKLLIAFALSVMCLASIVSADQPLIQDFLVRSHYLAHGNTGIHKANSYRVVEYTGIRHTKFMGKPIMLHHKAHGPLACVEKQIKKQCNDDYKPMALSGWRTRNTIKGHEISNHVFGIAIDIDPHLNPCCGCVANWAKVPRCKDAQVPADGSKPMGKYELPECWIRVFKENGWYWLGDEPTLRDTMHFEYLAKPGTVTCE
jgi:hypothetical protein